MNLLSPFRHTKFCFCALLVSLIFGFSFFTTTAKALPPQNFVLSSLNLVQENNYLYANMAVSVDDEDGLRDMLKDGAVMDLSIEISVERKRSWWSNSSISTVEYASTIQHLPLTREFQLTLTGKPNNPLRDKNLTRLLLATWQQLHIRFLDLATLADQPVDRDYIVSASIRLRHKEVPPWLEKGSMFWSADVVPSQTISAEFHR